MKTRLTLREDTVGEAVFKDIARHAEPRNVWIFAPLVECKRPDGCPLSFDFDGKVAVARVSSNGVNSADVYRADVAVGRV